MREQKPALHYFAARLGIAAYFELVEHELHERLGRAQRRERQRAPVDRARGVVRQCARYAVPAEGVLAGRGGDWVY